MPTPCAQTAVQRSLQRLGWLYLPTSTSVRCCDALPNCSPSRPCLNVRVHSRPPLVLRSVAFSVCRVCVSTVCRSPPWHRCGAYCAQECQFGSRLLHSRDGAGAHPVARARTQPFAHDATLGSFWLHCSVWSTDARTRRRQAFWPRVVRLTRHGAHAAGRTCARVRGLFLNWFWIVCAAPIARRRFVRSTGSSQGAYWCGGGGVLRGCAFA